MKVWVLVRTYPSKQARIAKVYTKTASLKRFILWGLRNNYDVRRDYHIHELELEDFEFDKPRPLTDTALSSFITQALLTYETTSR
jgi:hypothetical protein